MKNIYLKTLLQSVGTTAWCEVITTDAVYDIFRIEEPYACAYRAFVGDNIILLGKIHNEDESCVLRTITMGSLCKEHSYDGADVDALFKAVTELLSRKYYVLDEEIAFFKGLHISAAEVEKEFFVDLLSNYSRTTPTEMSFVKPIAILPDSEYYGVMDINKENVIVACYNKHEITGVYLYRYDFKCCIKIEEVSSLKMLTTVIENAFESKISYLDSKNVIRNFIEAFAPDKLAEFELLMITNADKSLQEISEMAVLESRKNK